MKKVFDYIVFASLLVLVGLANSSLFGVSFSKAEKETVEFNGISAPYKIVYTMPTAKGVSGYGGPIPMAIAVGEDQKVLDIKVLKNAETPSYFKLVLDSKYLKNWIGKSLKETTKIEVDGVSGATLSSTAIAKSLKLTFLSELGEKPPTRGETIDLNILAKSFGLFAVLLLATLSFLFPKKVKVNKTFLMTSSILVLGIWQGTMLSTSKISAWVINGVSFDLWGYSLLLVCIVSILLPAFTGRNFYCFYLCPFGAAQELVAKSVKVSKFSLNKFLFKGIEKTRVVILVICFIFLILGIGDYIVDFEPFSSFRIQMAPIASISIFGAFLILSIFIPRAWCKYFCPCGAFLDLFKKES